MLTSDDIKRLVDSFATRYDLERLATKDDLDQLRRDVMDKMDAIYKEVLDRRIEQDMHLALHERIDGRLNSIEKVPVIAHSIKR